MALAKGGLPPNWKVGDPVPTAVEGGSANATGDSVAVAGLQNAAPAVPGYVAPESAAGGTRSGPQGQTMGAGLYSGAWLKANGFGGVVGDGGDNNQYQLSANGGGWHQVGGSAYGTPSYGPGAGGPTMHESPPQTSNVPPAGGAAPPAAGAGLGSTGEVREAMNTAPVQGPGGGGVGGGPGLEYIDAPMSMRQGIGQRNLPMLSAALAGLGRTVY